MQRYNVPLAMTMALLAGGLTAGRAPAQPRVVASIKPVHALAAAVMEGVGSPLLLVRGGGSPHTYALRPSEARALNDAEIVFWIGPAMEVFLAKPLAALGGGARVVGLTGARGVHLLEQREGGPWAEEEAQGAGHQHARGVANPHIWLDPRNAAAMADAMAEVLARTDAAHGARYRANGQALRARLAALDDELARRLAPLRERPFLVFHDAYPYLEARYGLHAVGAISVSPERPPGARRITELRERLRTAGAVCVFAEPQFEPHLVRTLIEGSATRSGVLDPLGADLPDGPQLYPRLMHNLADALAACLGAP